MWTNINTREIAEIVKAGSVIAIDPDQLKKACVVSLVTPKYIQAVHTNRKKAVIILLQKEMISGKWWVQHELIA